MALGLLGEALEVLLHQLVTREDLECRALLLGELLEVLRVLQPLHQLVGDRKLPLDAAEDLGEDSVERVFAGVFN